MQNHFAANELFILLEAWTKSASGPGGFKGTICIGAPSSSGHITWLKINCERGSTARVAMPVMAADVIVLLDREQLGAILDGKGCVGRLRLSGNAKLWSRFLERYVRERSVIDIRSRRSA